VCLTMFLIDPSICFQIAFNNGGHTWTLHHVKGPKQPQGQLTIAFDANSDLLSITARSLEEQQQLRLEYSTQPGVRRTILGLLRCLPLTVAMKAAAKAIRKAGAGGGRAADR